MAADRVYENFEPFYEWARGERRFTIMLPGYTRNQLKIQVTSKPALKLMGERLIFGNRWCRFNLEFPIPSDYDTDNVTATFEGGKLSVTFAKLTTPKETTYPPEEAPGPKEPSQKVDEQMDSKEDTPKAKEEKAEPEAITSEVSDQKTLQKDKEQVDETEKTLQKDKEQVDETEKRKTETGTSIDKGEGEGEVKSNSSTEITETAISKVPKTKDGKSVARSKTRLVDLTLSNQVENEASRDLAAWLNNRKKLVKWVLLSLLVVGLGLYSRNAFRSSSHGEWNFTRVFTSLLKYFY